MTGPCFVCPQCRRRSYNREDIRFGYCGSCHEFTGGQHGHNGHSSSSLNEGWKGEMFMQPNDKDQRAKPGMSEVQGEGNRDSLPEMQRERMEPGQQQAMHELRGSGTPIDGPVHWINLSGAAPPWKILPSPYRFYIGAVAVGITMGISWTLALIGPTSLSRHISRAHALNILWGVVGAMLTYQTIYLILESRRLKRSLRRLREHAN
jgi:hypothetical protein